MSQTEFAVRRMDSDDDCACLIEAECFPAGERIHRPGIRSFLRKEGCHGLTVVEYDRGAVAWEAYLNFLGRGGRVSRLDNPTMRVHDWCDAVRTIGRRVGYLLYIPRACGVQVCRVGVLEQYRRRGLGRSLFQRLAMELPRHHTPRIWQMLNEREQSESGAFYQRLRFADGGNHLAGGALVRECVSNGNVEGMFAR